MKAISKYVLVLITFFCLAASHSYAACSNSTIKGKFAGQYHFPEDASYWTSIGAIMLRFDGAGKIAVIKGTEGSNGDYGSGTGNGTYKLNANCTGSGNFTLKSGGQIIARGRFDMYVAGTANAPEILGSYQNTITGHVGSLRLIKSRI